MLTTITKIEELIEDEIKSGIPSQNIFIIGYSQGGSVALSMTMISRYQLGGIIGLATFLPYHKFLVKHEAGLNKITPIFMFHGEKDKIVLCEKGQESAEFLISRGYQVKFTTYPQIGHYLIIFETETEVGTVLNQILKTRGFKPIEPIPEPEIKITKIEKNSP